MQEHIEKILNHPQRVPVAVGLAAFVGGLGIGYILGRRNKYEAFIELEPADTHKDPNQLRIEFDAEELAKELSEARDDIQTKNEFDAVAGVVGEIPVYETNPETGDLELVGYQNDETNEVRPAVEDFVAERLKESIVARQAPPPPPVQTNKVVMANVFAQSDGDWDYREEQLKRTSEEPYVLHKDEFYADELEYDQMTLTYYEGDDILVDEDDTPIYNYKQVVGELKWGHGCDDPNVVHIRNDKRKAEYEVLRHEGSFTIEVLGLEAEEKHTARDLKHSSERKFRPTE